MLPEETALDAVNAALGTTSPESSEPEVETEVAAPPEGEEGEAPADGEEGEAPAEGEEGEGEEGEEGADAEGRERNPDGTFKPKAGEKPPEGKPGEKPPEAKKPDPLNDPIPKDLKQETQERIRTLIKTTKEVTAERDKVATDFNFMVQGVQATGATPEQYGETLSWLAMFNSQDPKQQEQALELIEGVADRLATMLGKERSVNDPLNAHQDLQQAVRSGQITAQYAKEIARTRNASQFRNQLTEGQRQQETQQQQAQRELADARTGLNELERTLRATDPSYEAKRALLVPVLKPVFQSLPPSQWKAAFEQAYANAKVSAPAPRPKIPGAQPMRAGKQPAGGQTRAPNSMREALDGALAAMK